MQNDEWEMAGEGGGVKGWSRAWAGVRQPRAPTTRSKGGADALHSPVARLRRMNRPHPFNQQSNEEARKAETTDGRSSRFNRSSCAVLEAQRPPTHPFGANCATLETLASFRSRFALIPIPAAATSPLRISTRMPSFALIPIPAAATSFGVHSSSRPRFALIPIPAAAT